MLYEARNVVLRQQLKEAPGWKCIEFQWGEKLLKPKVLIRLKKAGYFSE